MKTAPKAGRASRAPKAGRASRAPKAGRAAPAPKTSHPAPAPKPVWGHFDQAELDRQYNSRATVPDFTVYTKRYAELTLEAKASGTCRENLRYGDGTEETFDFYPAVTPAVLPDSTSAEDGPQSNVSSTGAPVLVFLHGGDWRALSKDDSGFAVPAFNAAGVAFIALNFGLVPNLTIPQMGAQVRRALAWIARNIATHGGDPARIFIAGHSSGANLVAQLLITDWAGEFDLAADAIKGATFMSGLGDLEPVRRSFRNAHLKLNDTMVQAASLLQHAPRARCPLLVAFGANEMPEYHRQSQAVAAHWRRHGLPVEVFKLAERNHFDAVLEWAEPASALFKANLAMINKSSTPTPS